MPSQKQGGKNTRGLPELQESTPWANRLAVEAPAFSHKDAQIYKATLVVVPGSLTVKLIIFGS